MNYELIKSYINDFGFSLIPVGRDKRPLIPWADYQKKRLTPEEFKDMVLNITLKDAGNKEFEQLARFQGVGLITGEISGITILDFDLSSESTEWYAIFTEMNIPSVETVSGGRHFYFSYTPELYTLASKIHIDIRNNGGYAVMPPSKALRKDNTLGFYSWLKDLKNPLTKVPTDFLSWYKHKNQLNNVYTQVIKPVTSFEGATEGSRNQKATQVAGSLINSHRGDLELAWASLKTWNLERNNPPLGEDELKATFNSIVKRDSINNPQIEVEVKEVDLDNLLEFEFREELPIGIPAFDFVFRFPAGFYVVSGVPGTGKGWFALWLTRVFWERHNKKTVYFSLEMTEQLVRQRYLQAWSDLTEDEFKQVATSKDYTKIQKAKDMIAQKMMVVDEFYSQDTKHQTPENFKKLFEKYYQMGYRIFHFDHFHQMEGMNDNNKNQGVAEKWGQLFQSIAKEYPDAWLFIFAQPRGSAYKERMLRMEDISGSKSIIQKCEFFISLNKIVKVDKDAEILKIENDTRVIEMFLEKNRITSHSNKVFNLYNLETGNFITYDDYLRNSTTEFLLKG
jgi:hypothetical protein